MSAPSIQVGGKDRTIPSSSFYFRYFVCRQQRMTDDGHAERASFGTVKEISAVDYVEEGCWHRRGAAASRWTVR